MKKLFPEQKTAQFFEALFGDPEEGAYDIELRFREMYNNTLEFEFLLIAKPGRCLACSRTYGLPRVFLKHPVINIEELIKKIDEMINGYGKCKEWKLGPTRIISPELHSIPLIISITKDGV
jgi:hypothetical protein